MNLNVHVNKTNFHMKGFVAGLAPNRGKRQLGLLSDRRNRGKRQRETVINNIQETANDAELKQFFLFHLILFSSVFRSLQPVP